MGKTGSARWLADTLGKAWAAPYTLIGLVYGVLGYGAGRLAHHWGWYSVRPEILLGNNAFQFVNNPLAIPHSAITLGNTISYGKGTAPDHFGAYGDNTVNLGLHEQAHTWQYQILGPFFVPVYFLVGGITVRNPLEQAAQSFGRGKGSWWPWRRPS
ncbi:hypothetical protein [Oligoflexus tunisiensis]|uniref:hypothetical protein n=1 Tax=Oligoflexus tunisiensis TaxID=708132 RepID=UPI00114D2219|nr:hypothetical protein [Oligoflexus tunisiensis]